MRRLPRRNSATGTGANSAPSRRTERPVPKNGFFTSCCVMWKLRECDRLPNPLRQRFGSRSNRTMVLVEARVFCGDNGMLELKRDLAEWHKFVSFAISRAVNPCLHAALHVHRGGRRIDPPGSHQDQHGQRPNKRQSDENPSKDGPERDVSGRALRRRV